MWTIRTDGVLEVASSSIDMDLETDRTLVSGILYRNSSDSDGVVIYFVHSRLLSYDKV